MRRIVSGIALLVTVGCVVQAVRSPDPLLVWNVTASAPIGLYRRASGAVTHGDWALVRMPAGVAALASQRRYLPRNVPIVKRIAALSGDRVCRADSAISVNGVFVATALDHDSQGRALPRWNGCQRLGKSDVFLLTAPPQSFDSRYFGAVPGANLIERIEPLWTF